MSGHNKWSQIKRQKGATDAKKSKIFGKFARLITLESKKVSGNTSDPALRAVIDKAKGVNMPAENIERAIKKGTGDDAGEMERVVYEAYGPGGAALIIEGLTDSKNRTAAEIKHTLSKHGFALAAQGSALWAFTHTPEGWVPQNEIILSSQEATALEQLINALEESDDVQEVFTNATFPES
ncbi:MAG: YebC/PmpR family DNA-binding transcriptional regulator [Minisyncoccota bacterium]